jgi:hypothetical protein
MQFNSLFWSEHCFFPLHKYPEILLTYPTPHEKNSLTFVRLLIYSDT